MAPSASESAQHLPMPSRNPMPLSSSQETQVRDMYYKRVRTMCADEIRDFAACALNRTFTATWVCRQQRLSMNSCMVEHATQQNQDAAREEWFATRLERQRLRDEKERKRKEQEKFHNEWWGLNQSNEKTDGAKER